MTTDFSNFQIPRKEAELKSKVKQVQGLFRVVRRHQLVFNRGYGSDITVTIVSLFIGLIIEIMRLILEFLKCENLGTRIFKYSHTPSETREFRY